MANILISNIASWVTSRLKRSDLSTIATEDAYWCYFTICGAVPFDELMVTSPERPLVMNQTVYDLSDLDLQGIGSVRFNFGGTYRRARRSHVRVYDAMGFISPSRPATYARQGLTIEVNPPPDAGNYTYRIRYWKRPPSNDVNKGDVELITNREWNEIFFYETFYRVLMDIDEYEKAGQLVSPSLYPPSPDMPAGRRKRFHDLGIIPRLWNDMVRTISQREDVDEDFSINPIVRPYSNVR